MGYGVDHGCSGSHTLELWELYLLVCSGHNLLWSVHGGFFPSSCPGFPTEVLEEDPWGLSRLLLPLLLVPVALVIAANILLVAFGQN